MDTHALTTLKYLPTAVPSPRQLEFQSWEFGVFLHFGIRTFYEGFRDWDGQEMLASSFAPSQLDCDQWARTARDAGAKYIVLTAKHHDGFAVWPSRFSDFSVAHSPWKNGRGDVVREFVDACRRHDLKVGLYYSPAEQGRLFDDAAAYDEHFLNQIQELLGDYGAIDMLWFDGCGSEDHQYDWPRIMAQVRRLQPEILIFNMGDPDYRWIGNEAGMATRPVWNTVDTLDFSIQTDEKERIETARWLPAECDCRMRAHNWFYEDADVETVKSVRELMGLFEYSVGRGCNLLLNIGPDRRGLLPEPDATRLLEFGTEIRRRFGRALKTLADGEATDDGFVFDLGDGILLDCAILQEDLTGGERVRRFALEAVPESGGEAIVVYEGHNIGHKAICRFAPLNARQFRLRILETDAAPQIRVCELHDTGC